MQDQEEFTRSNDRRALIMKGKRTKRQRSSSPFGFTVTSSSSSGGDGGGRVTEEYNSIYSPTTSESTEEEEEMANCLIMLAQSDGPKRSLYVHECKTCNRSFPSFQALGGHMASHKKPKKQLVLAVNDAVIALRSVSTKKGHDNKIHECSICGSEFMSGQALGGHMRRHRAVNVDTISISTASGSSKLLLDLNLPAPDDDDDDDDIRDSQFQYGTTQQQGIVFSTPALVDCHY